MIWPSSFISKVALIDHETEKVAWNVKSDRAKCIEEHHFDGFNFLDRDGYVDGGPSSNKPSVTFAVCDFHLK